MPAKSKSQQRLFGMLHAYNKGELHGSKSLMRKMKSMSGHISDEDARHFAETPHKGLPEKTAELSKLAISRLAQGSPTAAYAKGLASGLLDKDTWHDAWAGANNASAQALSTLATIPTLGFENSLSSWLAGQKMPYSSASDTAARLADSSGDMSGAALSLAAGKGIIPKNLPPVVGKSRLTRGAKSFLRSLPTWGFYDPIWSKTTAELRDMLPGTTQGTQTIQDPQEQEAIKILEKAGINPDAVRRLSDGEDLDMVDLSSAPKEVPGQAGSALPAYLRAENNPEPNTPVTLKDLAKFLRPAAMTGAGLGAVAGGALGYALTDKKKSTWKKARNAALAALAAGTLGGLSGSAYRLYNATHV